MRVTLHALSLGYHGAYLEDSHPWNPLLFLRADALQRMSDCCAVPQV
jgi:hypothetical protein